MARPESELPAEYCRDGEGFLRPITPRSSSTNTSKASLSSSGNETKSKDSEADKLPVKRYNTWAEIEAEGRIRKERERAKKAEMKAKKAEKKAKLKGKGKISGATSLNGKRDRPILSLPESKTVDDRSVCQLGIKCTSADPQHFILFKHNSEKPNPRLKSPREFFKKSPRGQPAKLPEDSIMTSQQPPPRPPLPNHYCSQSAPALATNHTDSTITTPRSATDSTHNQQQPAFPSLESSADSQFESLFDKPVSTPDYPDSQYAVVKKKVRVYRKELPEFPKDTPESIRRQRSKTLGGE